MADPRSASLITEKTDSTSLQPIEAVPLDARIDINAAAVDQSEKPASAAANSHPTIKIISRIQFNEIQNVGNRSSARDRKEMPAQARQLANAPHLFSSTRTQRRPVSFCVPALMLLGVVLIAVSAFDFFPAANKDQSECPEIEFDTIKNLCLALDQLNQTLCSYEKYRQYCDDNAGGFYCLVMGFLAEIVACCVYRRDSKSSAESHSEQKPTDVSKSSAESHSEQKPTDVSLPPKQNFRSARNKLLNDSFNTHHLAFFTDVTLPRNGQPPSPSRIVTEITEFLDGTLKEKLTLSPQFTRSI